MFFMLLVIGACFKSAEYYYVWYCIGERWMRIVCYISANKVDIGNFACLNGDIWTFYTEMVCEKSSSLHVSFVKIAEFDWSSGRHQG